MKIDLQEFRNRAKYIDEIAHPSLPLILWNYNHSCQIDGAWNEYTLMSRGLITDVDGNIIARPFKKFFNVDEDPYEFKRCLATQALLPDVYEKLDGSLGILYWDMLSPYITTRGSFGSDQAKWATKWIQERSALDFNFDYTYLFEIIFPRNRIVVNYGDRAELVLIAVIDTETGGELDLIEEAKRLGLSYPKKLEYAAIENVNELSGYEAEGFVIKFKDNTRFKIKSDDYVRLHRVITGFSSKHIWECLANGTQLDDILKNIPDEFYKWAKQIEDDLREKFRKVVYQTQLAFKATQEFDSRKEKAIKLVSDYPDVASFVFALLDDRDIEPLIWKSLRPKYEQPFKKDTEEG